MLAAALEYSGIRDRVRRTQVLADGMLNTVIQVTFAGASPDVVVRLRHFHDPEYGQEFAAERFVYPLLAGKGVMYPALISACTDIGECGALFAVFEYVPGTLLDDGSLTYSSGRGRSEGLLYKIAQSLAAIHSVKNSGYGTHTSITHPAEQRRAFLERLLMREAAALRTRRIDFAPHYERAVEEWLDLIDLLPPHLGNPTLVHGDVHGRNLIVSRGEDVFLIDWESSRFRIAPYDLAQIRYVNLRDDARASDFLLKAYVESLTETTDIDLFRSVVEVCQYFWQCRMGLFFLQFPQFESPYFGTADEHLDGVRAAVRKF